MQAAIGAEPNAHTHARQTSTLAWFRGCVSVKEHQVCVNTASSVCHMDTDTCLAALWQDQEKIYEELMYFKGSPVHYKDKQQNESIISWRNLGLFLENQRNNSMTCALWQHDPWSVRGECGWDVLGHVLNVWLHFLILSSFLCFISSFDWQSVVMELKSLHEFYVL